VAPGVRVAQMVVRGGMPPGTPACQAIFRAAGMISADELTGPIPRHRQRRIPLVLQRPNVVRVTLETSGIFMSIASRLSIGALVRDPEV
jgi:hypothetical protein